MHIGTNSSVHVDGKIQIAWTDGDSEKCPYCGSQWDWWMARCRQLLLVGRVKSVSIVGVDGVGLCVQKYPCSRKCIWGLFMWKALVLQK